MKKIVAVVIAVVLMLTAVCAFAESEDFRTFCNPENYDLLLVSDVFNPDDEETATVIQGCFGTVTTETDESEFEFVGFDEENVFTLRLAADCTIELPADYANPVENAPADDLVGWFEGLKAHLEDDTATFLATFEMNEEGEITAIAYCYMP